MGKDYGGVPSDIRLMAFSSPDYSLTHFSISRDEETLAVQMLLVNNCHNFSLLTMLAGANGLWSSATCAEPQTLHLSEVTSYRDGFLGQRLWLEKVCSDSSTVQRWDLLSVFLHTFLLLVCLSRELWQV